MKEGLRFSSAGLQSEGQGVVSGEIGVQLLELQTVILIANASPGHKIDLLIVQMTSDE